VHTYVFCVLVPVIEIQSIGLPSEEKNRLLVPNYSLDKSRIRVGTDTGLGYPGVRVCPGLGSPGPWMPGSGWSRIGGEDGKVLYG
jgi:hypothetical protein